MLPIRIKACSESDLRMLGDLARNIQRVLPVTQADIDAAAALGKGWVVWKAIEVTDPIDNLRGGTQLVIKENSITPGKNVRRVLIVSGPGGETVVIGPGPSPLLLPDAIADSLHYVKAFGGTMQGVPDGYTQLEYIESDGTQYIDTGIFDITDSEFVLDAQLTATSTSGFPTMLGALNPTGGNKFKVVFGETSNALFYTQPGTGDNNYTYASAADTNRHTFKLTTGAASGGTLLIDNDSFGFNYEIQSDTTLSLYLSARNNNGNATNFISMTCYGLQIKKSGVLVRNMIPAKNSSNDVGMYDTVSGTFFENQGTGTFTAGPDVVPTPDAPMDIVSNNGVLKVRHQSGLPLGYTLLESATGYTGQSIIDSGIAGNNDKLRIVIKASKDISQNYTSLFGNYVDESSNVTRVIAGSDAGYVIFNLNRQAGSSDQVSGVRFTDLHTYDLYKDENNRSVLEIDGEVAGTSSNVQGTANATNISIGNSRVLTQEPSSLASNYWYFYFCKIYDDGVLIRDYVPVKRNSDNVVGIYDLVNHTFDAGLFPSFAPFSAGNVVSDPIEIYTDGTVETIWVHSKNLFDKDNALLNTTVNSQGVFEPNTSYNCSNYVPVQNGKTYIRSMNGVAFGIRYHLYDSNKDWLGYQDAQTTGLIVVNNPLAKYVAFAISGSYNLSAIQLEQGSTATTYEPYYNGGTATAEMLLKIGNYQDEQEILSGVVTRNVGVLVLDGTEEIWEASSSILTNCYTVVIPLGDGPIDNRRVYCTHLTSSDTLPDANARQGYALLGNGGSSTAQPLTNKYAVGLGLTTSFPTIAGLKQWLAAQYAAGTPVIIIYPLATETTESVTGQTLQVTDGNNTLEITQASLSGLELEAEYEKVA